MALSPHQIIAMSRPGAQRRANRPSSRGGDLYDAVTAATRCLAPSLTVRKHLLIPRKRNVCGHRKTGPEMPDRFLC
jgi:hypothetical protein